MHSFLEETCTKTYTSFYASSFGTNVPHDMEIHKFPILFIKEVMCYE